MQHNNEISVLVIGHRITKFDEKNSYGLNKKKKKTEKTFIRKEISSRTEHDAINARGYGKNR